MADIVVLVPSRNRPHNVRSLIEAFYSTSSGAAELVVVVDSDDTCLGQYKTLDVKLEINTGRTRLGPSLNAWAPLYAQTHSHVGFLGDDHWPRTQHWDQDVFEELKHSRMVYCNDLRHGPGLPTQIFMDSRIVQGLGYMSPPGMTHLWIDNFWGEVGNYLGSIKYLTDTIIEHMHHTVGKSSTGYDVGYQEVDACDGPDRARFDQYMREEFSNEMRKIEDLKHGSETV